jgi:hypothetical protein
MTLDWIQRNGKKTKGWRASILSWERIRKRDYERKKGITETSGIRWLRRIRSGEHEGEVEIEKGEDQKRRVGSQDRLR